MIAVISIELGVYPIVWCLRMLSRLFFGAIFFFSAAVASQQEVLGTNQDHQIDQQDALKQALTDLHVVTLETKDNATDTRHENERKRLLQRLVRSKGCTDKNHPRARLLAALHGFSRYEERNKAELKRWKDNYSHVPQRQKLVRGRVTLTRRLF
jgi:hypothetical protein